ncbi:MAG: hypothetical protein GXY72_07675 [Deltaproteobacteria bacterium]|nr:hypothetical protein [Syntrophaceae bacterium]NLX51960.1 hypothetical protein [Deltaproteobacteria bacterium]
MNYVLNTTDDYHVNALETLGWELTVCNALEPPNSPCRGALRNPGTFGVQLFHFLKRFVPFSDLRTVLEVGGGLGYLMRDFLSLAPHLSASMLDISPYLLQKQKETLANRSVRFGRADFLTMSISDLKPFELVILNENLGDFPTLVTDRDARGDADAETRYWVDKINDIEEEFSLDLDDGESINIGALCIVEKLCGARIPYIYLSEHSCEASMQNPNFPRHHFQGSGKPEKIPLKGHTEYTVKFSHLVAIARAFRYKVIRGQYVDILPLALNDRVRTAMRSGAPLSDEQEILQQFIYDLYKYEYLVFISDSLKKG